MTTKNKKKYNYMENTLQIINKNFISLQKCDEKKNNQILQDVLHALVGTIKKRDMLFKAMYQRAFFGGSYNDGLKVGKTEEFDLDILLKLPSSAEPTLIPKGIPGFVHLQLKNVYGWGKQPEAANVYWRFLKLLDHQCYLSSVKVREWMEGVVQKTMNSFPASGADRLFTNLHGTFNMRVHKNGQALTLKISGPVTMEVDLVACFIFTSAEWLQDGFKPNPVKGRSDFFIVPKTPEESEVRGQPIERYWRLSFQEQERALICEKKTLKPTIKLLKKMRDALQHVCIASYYIKTVLLHLLEIKDEEFWAKPLSFVFIAVLKEYAAYIEKGIIPYYWNPQYNLIGGVNPEILKNVSNNLKAVIQDIELNGNPNNPNLIIKYLLDHEELQYYFTFIL